MKTIQYKYVADFKCVMEKCIDTCCGNWQLNINKESYFKISNILATQEFRDKVNNSISKIEISDNKYAEIKLLDNGFCPFLDKGICEVHAKYGESILPEICKRFPKTENQYFLTRVISASLSCPEIVRILSESESPYSIVHTSVADDVKELPHVFNVDTDLREKLVSRLRDSIIEILDSNAELEPDQVLFIISFYSFQVADIYGASVIRESDFKKISEIDHYFHSKDNLKDLLHDFYQSGDVTESLLFVNSILLLRERHATDGFTAVVKASKIFVDNYFSSEIDWSDMEDVEKKYKMIKSSVNNDSRKIVRKYLFLYIHNAIRRENLGKMSNMFVFCHMINIRYSILSFLLNCNAACYQGDMNKRFIEIVYLFSRSFDHDVSMMTSIYEALDHEGLISMEYAIKFLKL